MEKEYKYRIVVAGDLLPWDNNASLFKQGDAKTLLGSSIFNLFMEADFSIINLEGPLTSSKKKQEKIGPVIKAEKDTIKGIRNIGVKAVALANNHITDYLDQGYEDTIETLKENGIQFVGAGRSEKNIISHLSLVLGSKRICIYNVSEIFFNAADTVHAGVNLYDEYRVCNEIRELKNNHDYVIVIYHGGAEYFPYPTPQTRKRFHRMADCGADFITAQHTHCIGCEEYYKGAYLLYGQGNFLFAKQSVKPMTKEGFVLEFVFGEKVEIIKHYVELQDNACLVEKEYPQLCEFIERSQKIDDEDYIICQFENLKPDSIVEKYLLAFKGRNYLWDKLKYILPKSLWRRIISSYSPNQIMRNLFVLNSDRAREDVYFIWSRFQKGMNR